VGYPALTSSALASVFWAREVGYVYVLKGVKFMTWFMRGEVNAWLTVILIDYAEIHSGLIFLRSA
jgi:hypothetical protein